MISSEEKIKRRKMWWKVVVARNALLVARATNKLSAEAHDTYNNAYHAFTVYVDFGKKGRTGRTFISDIDNSGWFDLLDVDGEDYKWEDPL